MKKRLLLLLLFPLLAGCSTTNPKSDSDDSLKEEISFSTKESQPIESSMTTTSGAVTESTAPADNLPTEKKIVSTTAPTATFFSSSPMAFSTTEGSVSIPDESSMEEVIYFDEPDRNEDVTEGSVDNWLLDGFVVPENWQEVLTTEETFENFDAIIAPLPEGASLEDQIVLLMNRNILCFDTGQLRSFELIDPVSSVGGKAEMPLVRVYSEHFKSVQDIKNLYYQTYTETYAHYLFYGTEDKPLQIFIKDEEGILWVDLQKVGNWVTDPFRNQSYIEIVNRSESICEFIWHYISYDSTDLSYDFFPIHRTINGFAINENGEWRLAYLILDNPELNRPTFKWRPVSTN